MGNPLKRPLARASKLQEMQLLPQTRGQADRQAWPGGVSRHSSEPQSLATQHVNPCCDRRKVPAAEKGYISSQLRAG